MFAHGYGCDQQMWRFVAPSFTSRYRVIVFDLMGAGGSDTTEYSQARYSTLDGHVDDIIAIGKELKLKDAIFIGHSVSAMLGVLAAAKAPALFKELILVGPSPRYINDGDYVGGFEQRDIDDLLSSLESNYLGWSHAMAPVIMGNAERPELGDELTTSFCRMDPAIAKTFARATFLSDNRKDLAAIKLRTLILQCSDDVIAPQTVGDYVHEALINSELVIMSATGHCPNLSAPAETISAIDAFLVKTQVS